jgi:hypothetical protein
MAVKDADKGITDEMKFLRFMNQPSISLKNQRSKPIPDLTAFL